VAVFIRLLDGVKTSLVGEVRRQVRGIRDVPQVRARWIDRLHAEADIAIDPRLSVGEGIATGSELLGRSDGPSSQDTPRARRDSHGRGSSA
jgi:hypothetical protein